MKMGKRLIIAIIAGVLLSFIAGNFSTSNYPPCDLTSRNIGVPTDGCNKTQPPDNYPCKDERPKTTAMVNCINSNYYRIKTFPFGFEQEFGQKNFRENRTPMILNSIGVAILGFLATLLLIKIISDKKTKSNTAENVSKTKKLRIKPLKKAKTPKTESTEDKKES
jgi:hypothetical protein